MTSTLIFYASRPRPPNTGREEDVVTFQKDGSARLVEACGEGYGLAKANLINFNQRIPKALCFPVEFEAGVMTFEGYGKSSDFVIARSANRFSSKTPDCPNRGFWNVFQLDLSGDEPHWDAVATMLVKSSTETRLDLKVGSEDGYNIPKDLLEKSWDDTACWPEVKSLIALLQQEVHAPALDESASPVSVHNR